MSDRKILKPARRGNIDPKVIKIAVAKVKAQRENTYPKEQELADRLDDLIHEYDGELSLVAVLGVLALTKEWLIGEALDAN